MRVLAVDNPGGSSAYALVVQYTFVDVTDSLENPGWTIKLFVMSRQGDTWYTQYTANSLGKNIRSFQVADLNGDGEDEIAVDAEHKIDQSRIITLDIFKIERGQLIELLEADTSAQKTAFTLILLGRSTLRKPE